MACGDPGMQFDTTINDWHTCPNTGRINASNPCSEYMYPGQLGLQPRVDQPAQVPRRRGEFDVRAFRHAVDVMITAQEILVDNSSYPTEEIGRNARDFRELGLGYANLGALLMALGLPYDSDQGRSYAGAITALMTGEAYAQSARIAQAMGPFNGYAINREPMLKVIASHREQAYDISIRARAADLLARRARGVGRGATSSARARATATRRRPCSRRPAPSLHDGLRHHRRRAGHRARQVQEAGRRRDAEDRQRHRAARAAHGSATTRARSRRSSRTSTSTTRSRVRRTWPTSICRSSIARSSRARARARFTTRAICA